MGNRGLLKGLYIYDRYDFKKYPVIRIGFGSGDFTDEETINKKTGYILRNNNDYICLMFQAVN